MSTSQPFDLSEREKDSCNALKICSQRVFQVEG